MDGFTTCENRCSIIPDQEIRTGPVFIFLLEKPGI